MSNNTYRMHFPRGLLQPEGSFRFSVDALLLASFAAPHSTDTVALDMGTGCGVIAFSLALKHPQLQITGLDCEQYLLDAAMQNAWQLDLAERFTPLCVPVQQVAQHITAHSVDLITANPPYHPLGSGRMPASSLRQKALFELTGSLDSFSHAAKQLLTVKGRFCCIYPAHRLEHLIHIFAKHSLYIQRLLPVHSKAQLPARFVLVAAMLQRSSQMQLLPPLVLYKGEGEETQLCNEAVEFCPELACNS